MRFIDDIKIEKEDKKDFLYIIDYLFKEFEVIKNKIDLTKIQDELDSLESSLDDKILFSKNDILLEKRKNKLKDIMKFLEEINQEILIVKNFINEGFLFDVSSEIIDLSGKINSFIEKVCFSSDNDQENCIVELQAGAGGVDSQDWAAMMLKMYTSWANINDIKIEISDISYGEEAGLKSCSFSVIGKNAYGLLKNENGIHRMVRLSPFNAKQKRQTNFVSFNCYPDLSDSDNFDIKVSDLKIETYRSSGAGGQHVNTTDSAVRIHHLPTGVVVKSQSQRSQHQNKSQAMKMLKNKLMDIKKRENLSKSSQERSDKVNIEWGGSQVRNYILHPYSLVKDLRSGFESSSINAILNGDINNIIKSLLIHNIVY